MSNYVQHLSGTVAQTEKAEPNQVKNSAGGYTFQLTPMKQLERFLILGSDAPTYYATARALTRENAQFVERCWKEWPYSTAELISSVSASGRAPKNDSAIFALALGAAAEWQGARENALRALPVVCRTGTHLFQWVQAVNALTGWGRGKRRAVERWMNGMSADQLAYQAVKYQARDGWSFRDVLRLTHPKGETPQHRALFRWIAAKDQGPGERTVKRKLPSGMVEVQYPEVGKENIPELVVAFERMKKATELKDVLELIEKHRMTLEMVPNQWKDKNEVWELLFRHMPVHALVRNLGQLTARGLIAPLSEGALRATSVLTNDLALKKARMHPLQLLIAQRTYAQGHGMKGGKTWTPVGAVTEALEAAFYASFGALEPSNKRTLIAMDISASMTAPLAGYPISSREAAACLAMVVMRTEKQWAEIGFSTQVGPIGLTPSMSLNDVCKKMDRLPFRGTDCALPILWAAGANVQVDTFVTITDNETWFGNIHPHIALNGYRSKFVPGAKMAVWGTATNAFTIANPEDAGHLDIVGFDTSAPQVLADFSRS
jgi:60 kDa SS-A/Ro ribonucleoprotein